MQFKLLTAFTDFTSSEKTESGQKEERRSRRAWTNLLRFGFWTSRKPEPCSVQIVSSNLALYFGSVSLFYCLWAVG